MQYNCITAYIAILNKITYTYYVAIMGIAKELSFFFQHVLMDYGVATVQKSAAVSARRHPVTYKQGVRNA